MTLDEFIKMIATQRPQAVPGMLTRYFPFVRSHLPVLMEQLHAQNDLTVSIRVAMLWIMALSTTQGAIENHSSGQAQLTPFGIALLNRVIDDTLGTNSERTFQTGNAIPTDEELHQLDYELWGQATSDDPRNLHALLLARLTRAAIALAPTALTEPRHRLAATALFLAELLETVAEPSEQATFAEEVHALLTSAASCIPPDRFEWARSRAIATYHEMQQHDATFNQQALPSMTTEELIALIMDSRPSAIPDLIVAQLPIVFAAPMSLAQQLLSYEQPHSSQVAAALLCLKMILHGSHEPTVFPFGVRLLVQLSQEEAGKTTFLPAEPDPTEADFQQVDSVLWSEVETDDISRDQGLLLVRLTRIALNLAPPAFVIAREELAVTAVRLGIQLYTTVEQEGGDDVLDETITLFLATADCFSSDSRRWAESRVHCGRAFEKRYEWHRNTTDLDNAIDCYRKASGALAVGSPQWYGAEMLAASALRQRHEALNNPTDLDQALDFYAQAAASLPDESYGAHHHRIWAKALYTRYEITRSLTDLNDVIKHCTFAVALLSPDSVDWADSQMLWALALTERYRVLGTLDDLDEAITRYEWAAPVYPIGSQDGAGCHMNWGSALADRYEARITRGDLERAMEHYARAIVIFPPDSINWARCQLNWANALHQRFRASTSRADLDDAVIRYTQISPLFQEIPGEWALCQMNWANTLVDRYRLRRDRADLDEAIERYAHAIEVYQEIERQAAARSSFRLNPIDRANCQVNWGVAYAARYEALGDLADLDAAITCYKDAAEVFLPNSLDRAACDVAWGSALFLRHRASENSMDLDEAMDRYMRATRIFPVGSIEWGQCQMSLANVFQARYELYKHPADLTEAVNYYTRGASVFPADSFDEAQRQASLANSLLQRYQLREDIGDLTDAITYFAQAAAIFPADSLDEARCLLNWGAAIMYRFVARQGAIDDLDAAFVQFDRAAGIYPPGSPGRANCQMNAGLVLRTRYEMTRARDDLENAVQYYREATQIFNRTGMLVNYQQAQVGLGRCHLLATNYSSAYEVLADAINLLERRLLGLPTQRDQLRVLNRGDNAYHLMVTVCLAQAKAADDDDPQRWLREAWQYVERSRARLTVQTIMQSAIAGSSTSKGVGQRAIESWAQIEREITNLYDLLGQRPNRVTRSREASIDPIQRIQAIETEFGSIPARIQALETELAQARKKLRDTLRPTENPNLDAVQQQLRKIPDGALLVEFFLLPDSLVVFLLDGEVLRVEQAAITAADLRTLTRSFRSPHTEVPGEQELERALTELSAHLAIILAPRLADLPTPPIEKPDRVPHVFLLPTADLHFWPLHALPLGDGTRLLDHYAVSLLPTAGALPTLAAQKVLPGPYYGFAPPIVNLPHALHQIYAEAAILGGSVMGGAVLKKGAEATFDALRAVRGGILSFATHAVVDLAAPERSRVQLAAPNSVAEPLEGITALEFLVGLDQLHCSLLLLWGCRTHGEGAQAGDNWLGISRAFLRAGRTLVSSLWSVEDEPTLAISVEFARGLTSGLTVPQALRRAIQTVQRADLTQMEEWGHTIAEMLPVDERDKFFPEWETTIEWLQLCDLTELGVWAPYVVIGWPSVFR
jgi:tetratricopeptide (TPR) repeat protein